jgi:hypothetical protein
VDAASVEHGGGRLPDPAVRVDDGRLPLARALFGHSRHRGKSLHAVAVGSGCGVRAGHGMQGVDGNGASDRRTLRSCLPV